MMLSKEELNEIFEYKEGKLYWNQIRANRLHLGDEAGAVNSRGYLGIQLSSKNYKVHQIVWIMHFGNIPENLIIDHIDGNKINNNLNNLRLVTNSQNKMNSLKFKKLTSKYKGVSWNQKANKWQACVRFERKNYHIGYFGIEEEAHKAYCFVAKEIFGEFFNNGKGM